MKARFEVAAVEDRGPQLRRRYFLAFYFPEAPEEGDPVEDILYETAVNAVPADFDFPDATHHRDTQKDGVWILGEDGLTVGDIVDMELSVVGRVELR